MSETPTPTESLEPPPSGARQGRWGIWVIFLVLAGVYLVVSRPKPVKSATPWVYDYDAGLTRAKQNDQLILIEFFATWCEPCHLMDKNVFSQQKVADALANWVPIKIDVDRQTELAGHYNIRVMPTFVILSPEGTILKRAEETMSSKTFIQFIQSVEMPQKETPR